jgi:hypothetical protein
MDESYAKLGRSSPLFWFVLIAALGIIFLGGRFLLALVRPDRSTELKIGPSRERVVISPAGLSCIEFPRFAIPEKCTGTNIFPYFPVSGSPGK